jgi:hypothetical protein
MYLGRLATGDAPPLAARGVPRVSTVVTGIPILSVGVRVPVASVTVGRLLVCPNEIALLPAKIVPLVPASFVT